ncbi:glycosyltransferase family 87 protein [Kiloniella majae]|uniref:glycosyltransferase family 87 protein n=1 Tax=Kiloniella majae TaxID=1938558 RepID=UPI000F7AFD5F|nr:glycosyltransferase family 87 protein [Kiloniella majae]
MAVLTISLYLLNLIMGTGLESYFGVPLGVDFLAFYTGGSFYLNDTLSIIYNHVFIEQPDANVSQIFFTDQLEFQKNIIGPEFTKLSPFINPPFAALLYAPFANFDYATAYIFWTLLNLALLLVSVLIMRKELPKLREVSPYKLYFCCFLFFPTIACFMYGQAASIILLIYCLCFKALRNDRDFSAGFYLGLLLLKPQLAVGVAFIIIIKWRWQAILGGITSVILIGLFSIIFMPNELLAYLEITPHLLDLLRADYYPTWGINSFFGFAALLFDHTNVALTNALTLTLTVSTLFLLILLWREQIWLNERTKWDLSMAVTFCWGLLISPHLYYYDLMLLLLPTAIIIQYLPWLYARNSRIILWITIAWISCYLGSQLSVLQLGIFNTLGFPEISFQFITPILFYLGYTLYKSVRSA